MDDTQQELLRFYREHNFKNKGPLSVALVVTQHARDMGLPLAPEQLLTERGGQVLGLGRSAVQSVLGRYGIERVLAQEGGRTSRGSINNMRAYVALLNSLFERDLLRQKGIDEIEAFWVERVKDFFAGQPFKIKMDSSKGLRAVVRNILMQAEERQKESPGTWFAGTVMQHLVGAKLDIALGEGKFEHHSSSTSDQQSGRFGDFSLQNTAIHVTTAPAEALIKRCRDNLESGLQAIIVTTLKGVAVAEGLSENENLSDRIDVFEIEQFIALNLYELSGFDIARRRPTMAGLVERYNWIIDEVETDPSLKVELS